MSITLFDYHKAVKEYLENEVEWLNSVMLYPEIDGAIATPSALFAITSFEKSDVNDGSGKFFVDLSCELLVLFSMQSEDYQLTIRDAVMALCLKINDCRFGLQLKPAVFLTAQPDGLVPELDDYEAWSIQFTQQIELGNIETLITADHFKPSLIKKSNKPEIGLKNEDKYQKF